MNYILEETRANEVVDWSYFEWLTHEVGIDAVSTRYSQLLAQLSMTQFVPFVERDTNRVADGIELRQLYSIMTGKTAHMSDGCSVLEMLVALAVRIDRDVVDAGATTWFATFMRNLYLDAYDDDHYNPDAIAYRLDVWMRRDYDVDGSGGLFPLYSPTTDQRNEELWSQMQQYVHENYALT